MAPPKAEQKLYSYISVAYDILRAFELNIEDTFFDSPSISYVLDDIMSDLTNLKELMLLEFENQKNIKFGKSF